VIITNAALRGRAGTWDIHIDNAAFGSIVAWSTARQVAQVAVDADKHFVEMPRVAGAHASVT
jgi:hypothetical protein